MFGEEKGFSAIRQKMENILGVCKEEEQLDLPPGFRFHPTDEELITHYLQHKVINSNFSCRAIGDVDLNKSEPWDLPWKAKMGEKEWYFFCVRDRKYPTGLRTNRATEAGYWKATGKDKEIYKGKSLVGMKKTLVFYRGRAPKGVKSNWVMHEYRLEGNLSVENVTKTTKNEWVICRVFQKTPGGKKTHISGIMRLGSYGNDLSTSPLPPLTDSSPSTAKTKPVAESAYVPCFSNSMNVQRNQLGGIEMPNSFHNPRLQLPPNLSHTLPSVHLSNSLYTTSTSQAIQFPASFSLSGSVYDVQEDSLLRAFLQSHGTNARNTALKRERDMISPSQETGLTTTDMNPEITSVISNFQMGRRAFDNQGAPPVSADLDSWWNC